MCVSRYIIPKTGYMMATRSKKYDMPSDSKQTTYFNYICSAYILRLTMSGGQFTKFSEKRLLLVVEYAMVFVMTK